MADEVPEDVQRWTAKRRAALVLSIVKGETSVAEAARKHGLKVAEVEEWRDRFLLAPENALRSRPRDEDALKDEEIKRQYGLYTAEAIPRRAAADRAGERAVVLRRRVGSGRL